MRHVSLLLAALATISIAPRAASAQVAYYERTVSELPASADRSAAIVLVSSQPGAVRWGLDGWKLPDPSVQPAGTTTVAQGAVETPLEGPCPDGNYRAKLGPFSSLASAPAELDFVLHFASGAWDSNGGQNYKIALAAPGTVAVHRRPITIGTGPYLGSAGGTAYYEQVEDWDLSDCHGLDPADDEVSFGDGLDSSRDLVAFYSRHENGNLFLRVDVLDLALGAETSGGVVLGFLIEWGGAQTQSYLPDMAQATTARPWNLAFVVHDEQRFEVYDPSWNLLAGTANDPSGFFKGVSYRSDLDTVELGLSEAALRKAGWDGKAALRFQVYTQKDGDARLADVFQDGSLTTLTSQVSETAGSSTVKLATIIHGNQAVQPLGDVRTLISSTNITTPAGKPTGYHRALDAHQLFRSPVNFHVSGTLAATLQWAQPDFNARICASLSGKPWWGHAAMVGGVLSEHMLPYFESSKAGGTEGPNVASARINDQLLASIYHVAKPRVFWSPERVLKGTTFADVAAAGYGFTVVDQVTHLTDWFGASDAQSTNGRKINRISGVNCFAINDDVDQWKFANTDGGLWLGTRRLLVGRGLESDQQQINVQFDDWEAFSGRSFTSFGVGNNNPDNYDLNVRWIAAHPWIQAVTLDDVASWGWGVVDRGNRTDLTVDTYDWLRHATEKSYDNWFFGSSLEENFSGLHPQVLNATYAPKAFGELGQAGTILGDTWSDVNALAPSPLRDLASAVYGEAIFETAWHDQSLNDYQDKTASGDYLFPDTTYQGTSVWAKALQARTGDASAIAAAARWAANPPAAGATSVFSQDVDQDGVAESCLANDQIFCVFKGTGGRLFLAAARDPVTGDADIVAGSFLQGPGNNLERDRVEESTPDVLRPGSLCDWWSTGSGGSRYVNATYSVQAQAAGYVFTSDDGKVKKTVSLSGNQLLVRYDLDPSVGDLYVRFGLAPAPLSLLLAQGTLTDLRPSNACGVSETVGARTVQVLVAQGTGSAINDAASFGTDGARSVAFSKQVEVHGTGTTFDLSLQMTVTK
jgi:hypothetical protein